MSDWQYVTFTGCMPVRHDDFRTPEEMAYDRAKKLFLRHCSYKQQKEFEKNKGITVKGNLGGIYFIECENVYLSNIVRIERIKTYNIFGFKFSFKRKSCRYCMHIQHAYLYPHFDHFLAQKIAIETNERRFLHIAFKTGVDLDNFG